MNIAFVQIADGEYLKGAEIVISGLRQHITNPEGHHIEYIVDSPNHDFDYLEFMNQHHRGTKVSLGRFKYFNESKYDRIILIDSDMEIVGNVDLLISESLNSADYWACHVHGYENYYGERMNALNIPNSIIINGGLQIINKKLLSKEFQEVLRKRLVVGNAFDGSDQGYLSPLLADLLYDGIRHGWLDDKYNYCLQDKYHPKCDDVRINHYTGRKLWQ